ncbi:Uncharacterized protein APZ42_008719, partial [Daphnia magna]
KEKYYLIIQSIKTREETIRIFFFVPIVLGTPLEAALRNGSGVLKIWELETASIIDSAITFIFQEKYQIYGNWSALH